MKSPAAKQTQGKPVVPVGVTIKKPDLRKVATQTEPVAKQIQPAAKASVSKGKDKPALGGVDRHSSRRTRAAGLRTLLKGPARLNVLDFRTLYQSPPEDRIELIRAGVGATEMKAFAVDLGIPQDRFFRMFGIAQATVTRKASKQQTMSPEESEKIVGMAKLVGQVQTMLEQSGDPELMKNFDAPKWLARWIEEPIPALGDKRPADYMDTNEGREMVSRLLLMMQTGAYA